MKIFLPLAISLAMLAGCKDDLATAIPDAVTLNEEAAGHYCQMNILEHVGPKAQVHLAGYLEPLWFSQVRDGLVYLKSPEQSAEILVLYVNDMGVAKSWSNPGEDNWINAKDALYVVESDAKGGMGAPEIVPFGKRAQAEAFIQQHGGRIMTLDEIPAEMVLAPIDFTLTQPELTDDNS